MSALTPSAHAGAQGIHSLRLPRPSRHGTQLDLIYTLATASVVFLQRLKKILVFQSFNGHDTVVRFKISALDLYRSVLPT